MNNTDMEWNVIAIQNLYKYKYFKTKCIETGTSIQTVNMPICYRTNITTTKHHVLLSSIAK